MFTLNTGSQAQISKEIELDPNTLDVITAKSLLDLKTEGIKYLVDPLIPKIGVAVIVAKPDSGKSLLMEQLCIQIAAGDNIFAGQPLNVVNKRALYISTEDGIHAIAERLKIQKQNAPNFDENNLSFSFNNGDSKEIQNIIDIHLNNNPVDLVVVDAFGDIFEGNDSNSNMGMRHTIKPYQALAEKHKTAIIFIHHINKSGYSQSPSQEHIQGGSGLAQKVRVALQLIVGKEGKRGLIVLKGNYCRSEYKENAIVLLMNESTLWLSPTGERCHPKKIQPSSAEADQTIENPLSKLAREIFVDKTIELRHTDLIKKITEMENTSPATAKRRIADMVTLNIIIKNDEGKYHIMDESSSKIQYKAA